MMMRKRAVILTALLGLTGGLAQAQSLTGYADFRYESAKLNADWVIEGKGYSVQEWGHRMGGVLKVAYGKGYIKFWRLNPVRGDAYAQGVEVGGYTPYGKVAGFFDYSSGGGLKIYGARYEKGLENLGKVSVRVRYYTDRTDTGYGLQVGYDKPVGLKGMVLDIGIWATYQNADIGQGRKNYASVALSGKWHTPYGNLYALIGTGNLVLPEDDRQIPDGFIARTTLEEEIKVSKPFRISDNLAISPYFVYRYTKSRAPFDVRLKCEQYEGGLTLYF